MFAALVTIVGLSLSIFSLEGSAVSAEPEMLAAAKQGDTQTLLNLLHQGIDVNVASVDGTTALFLAVENDHPEAVDLLIGAGANPSVANRYGVAPILLAVANGRVSVVEALLAAGASANTTRADSGETALMLAARTGHVEVIESLVARGGAVNATEKTRGQTALMWAAAEQHAAAVTVLLKHGADWNARSQTGLTPLMFAIRSGDIDTTRALLDGGADIRQVAADSTTMLVLAIINGHYDLAKFLLTRGADPNVKDPRGTPLHVLTWMRNADARLNSVIIARIPAPERDTVALADALLAHGADVNSRIDWEGESENTGGRGCLQGMAIFCPDLSLVGATPFLVASLNYDVSFMRYLAAKGADPKIATRQGMTPLLAAAGVGNVPTGHFLRQRYALEAVQLAYELGNDVRATVRFGDVRIGDARWNGATALIGAAVLNNPSLIRWLAEKGVDLQARTETGWSPLSVAQGTLFGTVYSVMNEAAAALRESLMARGLSFDPLERADPLSPGLEASK